MIRFKVKIQETYRYGIQSHPEIMQYIKQGVTSFLVKADDESVRLESLGLIEKPWFLLSEVERLKE